MLGKFKEDISPDEQERRRVKLREWVNTQSKGEEGFTALHFASFHGNLNLIRLLIGYGGNFQIKNR